MSTPYKNLLRFLGASAFVILMAGVLNFVVDPLQLFRPARFYSAMYSPDSRLQDAGLIRSQDFDTVLMGTSLAVHFRQSDIDRVLGVRSVKLAMPGSTSHQQSFVLAAALERHPARVIWEVDDWIFRDAREPDQDASLPVDLYRRNARGIAGYLLSGGMARESLLMLARSTRPLQKTVARLTSAVAFTFRVDRVDDINSLEPDFNIAGAYNANRAVAAFTRIKDPARNLFLSEGYDYGAMVRNFESDAAMLIARHPGIRFEVYFPPYSILQWVAMREASPATLKLVYEFSAYMSNRLAQFPNAVLHDFREASEVTHDLQNYSDVIHHSPAVDLKILAWLAEGKYVVDRAAPLASLDRLKAQVEAYRIDAVGKP